MFDFHNHLIPGVDDGAESLEASLNALDLMWKQGITHVITTPHFRASVVNRPDEFEAQMRLIDEAWKVLSLAASEHIPQMKLDRGVELALDEPQLARLDRRLCLAGTRFMLVEFPYFMIPPNSAEPLAKLRSAGISPIIAHPERYKNQGEKLERARKWKQSGAFLQLNAGSILGAYGRDSERRGLSYLEAGLIDYVSSDYHARGECMCAKAEERFGSMDALQEFRILSTVNGQRLVDEMDPVPVGRVGKSVSSWRRFISRLFK